jgi:hypothetical protein
MMMSRAAVFQLGVFAMLCGLSVGAQAQSEGNNAIYSGSAIAASTAYIDAWPFYNNAN